MEVVIFLAGVIVGLGYFLVFHLTHFYEFYKEENKRRASPEYQIEQRQKEISLFVDHTLISIAMYAKKRRYSQEDFIILANMFFTEKALDRARDMSTPLTFEGVFGKDYSDILL